MTDSYSSLPTIQHAPFFLSHSGGKDSCLALYRAIQAGGEPQCLLTMLTEDGQRSHAHGLSPEILQTQASALSLPLVFKTASWNSYEATFLGVLEEFRARGITHGVFGDIDLAEHLEWVVKVCARRYITPWEPLWQGDRTELLNEFIDAGFKAIVVAVKADALDPDLLGKTLDRELLQEFKRRQVDASGENGEYHTLVVDGPIFNRPLQVVPHEKSLRDGYWFLELKGN